MEKKSKYMKLLDWIINILLIVSFVIMVYFVLWRIFGNSPTDFSVLSSILGFIGMAFLKIFTFIFGMNREIGELKIGMRELKGGVKNGFERVKEDITGLRGDIQEIKNLVKK